MKNLMGRSRPESDPYLVFEGGPFGPTKVLKAWQADHAKPYGRWFVAVNGDIGDTYTADILRHETLTYVDDKLFTDADGQVDPVARATFLLDLQEARQHLPTNAF